MGYLYRYIDIDKEEVIYVGKVMGMKDVGFDPLTRRHEQHKRDDWYKTTGEHNIVMQYIECSASDADILETWLINFYAPTGQLYNKEKADWGESKIDLYPLIFGKWKNYKGALDIKENIKDRLYGLVENLYRQTEGLAYHLEADLENFCESVKNISKEISKTNKFNRFNTNDEFKRSEGPSAFDSQAHVVQLNDIPLLNKVLFYEDRDWVLQFGTFHEITDGNPDGRRICFNDKGVVEDGKRFNNVLPGGHSFLASEYNKTWRVWDRQPTRKQREITKWED